MTDTDIDKRNETRRASLVKARQVLANERAAEREKRASTRTDGTLLATKSVSEFEGLAAPAECCDACHKDHCVISGTWYCAHPMGGGLQSKEKGDHTALKRFKRAKEFLKGAKLDLQKMTE